MSKILSLVLVSLLAAVTAFVAVLMLTSCEAPKDDTPKLATQCSKEPPDAELLRHLHGECVCE